MDVTANMIPYILNQFQKGETYLEVSFNNEDDLDFKEILCDERIIYKRCRKTSTEIVNHNIDLFEDVENNRNTIVILYLEDKRIEITIIGSFEWFTYILKRYIVIDIQNGFIYIYFKKNGEKLISYNSIKAFSVSENDSNDGIINNLQEE